MSVPAVKTYLLSEQEYLSGELEADIKHELVNGVAYAMAGASRNHERISMNVSSEFNAHLKGAKCEVFGSDLKVKTPAGNFRYPDCMVVCDDNEDNEYFTSFPVILVEVISRSTRKTDVQTKRLEYMNIPSLKEFVLIEQDFVSVVVFRRNDDWRPVYYFLGDEVTFESIELTLSVEDIYHRVKNQDMTDWLATAQERAAEEEQKTGKSESGDKF